MHSLPIITSICFFLLFLLLDLPPYSAFKTCVLLRSFMCLCILEMPLATTKMSH